MGILDKIEDLKSLKRRYATLGREQQGKGRQAGDKGTGSGRGGAHRSDPPSPPPPLPLCLDNELNDCTLFHDHQRLSHSCMVVVFLTLFHKQK